MAYEENRTPLRNTFHPIGCNVIFNGKEFRAVYCPVGGLPSTKNKPGDRPKGEMPT